MEPARNCDIVCSASLMQYTILEFVVTCRKISIHRFLVFLKQPVEKLSSNSYRAVVRELTIEIETCEICHLTAAMIKVELL